MLIPKQAGKAFIGTCLIVLPWTWISCDQAHETQINLIPEPAEMVVQSGYFPIDSTGLFGGGNGSVKYTVDSSASDLGLEGYRLEVNKSGVSLVAQTETGLFYGKQTLMQLITPQGLPCVKIECFTNRMYFRRQ